jgi:hypothetical protein
MLLSSSAAGHEIHPSPSTTLLPSISEKRDAIADEPIDRLDLNPMGKDNYDDLCASATKH